MTNTKYAKVTLNVTSPKQLQLTASIDLEQLQIHKQSNGVMTGYGFLSLKDGDSTYGHVKIWSYYSDPNIWHEILISNSSIESGVGYFEGSYAVELTAPIGDPVTITRETGKFFDGTGYIELIGEPIYAPLPGAEEFYTRYIDLKDPIIASTLMNKKYSPSLKDGFSWSALDWSTIQFDTTKDTHTTGSPRNVGSAWMPALAAIACKNTTKLPEITGHIFGWLGQQCRRPLHFFHDTGHAFSANEYPTLVMSEHGPSKLWSAKELWKRDTWTEEQKKKGKWSAWDNEHLTVDQLVAGYILYGSMFCLTQIKLIIEAVLTHPHLKIAKTSMSERVWGWDLRALAWAIFVIPNEADVARYKAAASVLIQAYMASAKYGPIPTIFPQPADGRHLYPTADEMLQWYPLNNLPLPETDPKFITALNNYQLTPNSDTDRALAKFLVDYLYPNFGYTELNKCLTTWSFVTPFQLAVMASGLSLYNDIHDLGLPQASTIAQHLVLCLFTKARNPSGTFWYDYGAVLPNHVVGDGTNMVGTTTWTAGGLAMLMQFVPVTYHKMISDSIKTVYNSNNKEALPSHDAFYSWFPQAFKALGHPKPIKSGDL